MSTTEEKINQMYDSQLASTKEQLQQDYLQADSALNVQKQKNQKATDTNLERTAVEAQKATVNDAELHNAYGLSSGARAQVRLSRENQMLANMTALRTAQQESDAEIERQRGILSEEYAAAIRKAQADNDLARAQALYEQAKEAEEQLRAQQEAAANLMAQTGDFSRYGALYGLTEAEIQALNGGQAAASGATPTDSAVIGDNGDRVAAPVSSNGYDNGSLTENQVKMIQYSLGVEADGKWGAQSSAKAGGLSADAAYKAWNKGELGRSVNNDIWAARGSKSAQNARVNSFIKQNMTLEQAISRGIGEAGWKALILRELNKADLTAEEFARLEAYYGIS